MQVNGQLYLMALPTNVPETKWGARLLEQFSGGGRDYLIETNSMRSTKRPPEEELQRGEGERDLQELHDLKK